MTQKIAQLTRLVVAVVAVAALTAGALMTSGASAYAGKRAAAPASARLKPKPPCTRCCLKMDKKTHRCAKYGYRRGKGKCAAKCK